MGGAVGPDRDEQADEYELHRVEAMVCEACLSGEPSECHTPGCAFWCCPSIDDEQGERLRNCVVEPRPVTPLPAHDDLPDEAVEGVLYEFDFTNSERGPGTTVGWWDGRYWTGCFNRGAWSPQYVTAWRPLRASIEAQVREQIAQGLEISGLVHSAGVVRDDSFGEYHPDDGVERYWRDKIASEIEALRDAHFQEYGNEEPRACGEDWGYTRAADAARGES